MFRNNSGQANVAVGGSAAINTLGSNNTVTGFNALSNNTTGANNIALGYQAGINITTGSNNVDIGNAGVAADSNTIRIGSNGTQTNAFMAGVSGVTIPKGVAVLIDSNGRLGIKSSAERFKTEIQPMDKASEKILAFKPVSFRYKKELDPEATPQFGLIAEDLAKVSPDLVVRDERGEFSTVRYDAVNVNEFLKEHQKVQKLEAILAAVNERLHEQDAKIDKVNHRLQLPRPRPHIADNR